MNAQAQAAPWEGVAWAVRARVLATAFSAINSLLMLFMLKDNQLGIFLVGQNLLQIFQVSDLGASGFLTTHAGDREGQAPGSQALAACSGIAGAVLCIPFLVFSGLHFLNAQNRPAVTPALWLFIVAIQSLSYAVAPLLSLADGLGYHRQAWQRIFAMEFAGGAGLTFGLLTGSAWTALVVVSLARGVLFPLLMMGLLDLPKFRGIRSGLRARRRGALAGWVRDALAIQATFFWINIAGFVPLRLIVPLVYQFQGPRAGSMVGIAMLFGSAAMNVATGFSLGAMGRLSVAYARGRLEEFRALLMRVSWASQASGVLLLGLAAAAIEGARHCPWNALTARAPDGMIYAPVFAAYLVTIGAVCPAVALRSTGRDTSAPLVGSLGLLSILLYRMAATLRWTWAVPVALLLVAVLSLLAFLFHWSRRRAEIRHPALVRS
jgi:hypothetical protein